LAWLTYTTQILGSVGLVPSLKLTVNFNQSYLNQKRFAKIYEDTAILRDRDLVEISSA